MNGEVFCFLTLGAFLFSFSVIFILIVLVIIAIRFLVHGAGLYFRFGRFTLEFQDLLLQRLYLLLLPSNHLKQRIHYWATFAIGNIWHWRSRRFHRGIITAFLIGLPVDNEKLQ